MLVLLVKLGLAFVFSEALETVFTRRTTTTTSTSVAFTTRDSFLLLLYYQKKTDDNGQPRTNKGQIHSNNNSLSWFIAILSTD